MAAYEELRAALGSDGVEVQPSSDEGRAEIHDALADGRVASFVDTGEQVTTLASLGYGRAAAADVLDLDPDTVDEHASEELDRIRAALGGGE